ncbi:MAG: anion permease [Clostridia bacterium]|nr:anion permease [Clostridia bacterium]
MIKVKEFIKNECVMLLSALLAVISSFIIPPDKQYISYVDFRTLALLFSLMVVMAGFSAMGIFSLMAQKLMKKAKSTRSLTAVLCLMCFFSSMVITNDVALITFVPFTVIALKKADRTDRLIFTVCLETVAANLGSMATPIGNPQNLFIFSSYGFNTAKFLTAVLPYTLLSFILILLCTLSVKKEGITADTHSEKSDISPVKAAVYAVLFVCALLSVFRVLDYRILLALALVLILIFDRKILLKVDYSLLFTFVFLFIFIGNLGRIPQISEFLKGTVSGNEVAAGILISQIFSNVPTAILLSGFTDNGAALLTGVNLGGLGTLIASMASLISFKFLQKEKVNAGRYLAVFTVMNIAFLSLNVLLAVIL